MKQFIIKTCMLAVCASALVGCSTYNPQGLGQLAGVNSFSDMYLRGVFNWWEANEQFKLVRVGNTKYQLDIELIADGQPYDFKVADANWTSQFNCGFGRDPKPLKIGQTRKLVCQDNSLNIQFTPRQTGTFSVTLDVSDGLEPTLRITRVQ